MIRKQRCQTCTQLKLLGLPKSLVWPELAGTSAKWRRAVSLCWALEHPGRWWAAVFYVLPGFRMAFVAVAVIQHFAVKPTFTGKLQIDSSNKRQSRSRE